MKGAFEYCALMLVSLPLIVLLFCFVEILFGYQQSRHLQEYAISLIEHHDRYDDQIAQLLNEKQDICNNCSIFVNELEQYYEVKVIFPIHLGIINISMNGEVRTVTKKIS